MKKLAIQSNFQSVTEPNETPEKPSERQDTNSNIKI